MAKIIAIGGGEVREKSTPQIDKMKNSPLVAIAIEDNCAIQIEDETYKLIVSNSKAKAYKVY